MYKKGSGRRNDKIVEESIMAGQVNHKRWTHNSRQDPAHLFSRERGTGWRNGGLAVSTGNYGQRGPFRLDEGKLFMDMKLGAYGIRACVDTGKKTTTISEGFAELIKNVGVFKHPEPSLKEKMSGVVFSLKDGRRVMFQTKAEERKIFKTDITVGSTTAVGMELEVDRNSAEFVVVGTDLLERLEARIDFGRL